MFRYIAVVVWPCSWKLAGYNVVDDKIMLVVFFLFTLFICHSKLPKRINEAHAKCQFKFITIMYITHKIQFMGKS